MSAAAPKKRGRPPGSKNKKPARKAEKVLPEKGGTDPQVDDFDVTTGLLEPNRGILEGAEEPFPNPPTWAEGHRPDSPAYPLNPEDLEWAKDNLRAIGLSEWAVHIDSRAGLVIKESIQKLWKKNKRPPSVDEICQETAMPWAKVEDCIHYLVEDEELIRIGELLIPVNVPRQEHEPEPGPVIEAEFDVIGELAEAPEGDRIEP